ncbi:heme peroxidase [Venturia nashicola]|uniref:Heme peroxidase n=1 Tax=Venturia nashicola TaxID=86259 RepID=A0A4Z1P6F4_9PEZI|nr:heme peroxidase [Venturia nashicola]TLD37055.1 heme peroxidase [Venturia nashicola]
MSNIKAQAHPVAPSELQQLRDRLGKEFRAKASLISAARRPLPDQTGNGTYLDDKPIHPDVMDKVNEGLRDLSHLGIKDVETLLKVVELGKSGEPWQDKEYLMEHLIQTASILPDDSTLQRKVTDGFLTQLYNDLQHPPISYLGRDYQYRTPDGSFNSLVNPNVGKSGTPYARTTAPKAMQPGALPDPGIIFDSIMARKDSNREDHPNEISSVLFYLASIIIHDLFKTNHIDPQISETSSYLDLAPLYGSNLEEQMKMRTGYSGKIRPDSFSETRLLSFPPGVGTLLIMFNRFHQNVAEQLAAINEKGQFTRPEGEPPKIDYNTKEWWKLPALTQTSTAEERNAAAWRKYDEDLFQVSRLCTSGLYVQIVLQDYVRTILNLNKTDRNWVLNPRSEIKGVPLAAGNQVSAEFNLVYRWHSAISAKDEKWTENLIKHQFIDEIPDGDLTKLSYPIFMRGAMKMEQVYKSQLPNEREFAGLERQSDGTFKDDDLVKIIAESVEDCANSFGANRVPVCMRVIEQLGIEQSRAWSLASLNEFRKYFNLAPHKSFTDINSDPEVAAQLSRLYDHPDQVELYPGLVAEEPKKPLVPGAGLTPSYTVSRAVLSDAVALVRGDRFYTIDFHPKKLTNWGYSAVAFENSVDNGCIAYKLFLNAFPQHFRPNSIYAHYPMTIPSEMESVMKTLGRHAQYSYDKPGRLPETHVAFSGAAVKALASNTESFRVTWGGSMEYLISPSQKDFMATNVKGASIHSQVLKTITADPKWDPTVRKYFEDKTATMIAKKAYKLANLTQVDIIRDVGNLVPVHYVSELFSLPLKTSADAAKVFTEHELYLALLSIYTSFLKDTDSIDSFPMRQVSYNAVQTLGRLVQANVDDVQAPGLLRSIMTAAFADADSPIKEYGDSFIACLLNSGLDAKHVVWGHVLSTASGVTATLGSLFATCLDYFLAGDKKTLAAVQELANQDDDRSFEKLQRFVLEAARLSCQITVYRSVNTATTFPNAGPKGQTLELQAGDHVLLNLRSACRDEAFFPKPEVFDPTRPFEAYMHLGMGPHENLGFGTTKTALTAMLKVVLRLKGLKAATGPQGVLHKVEKKLPGGVEGEKYSGFLTENWDGVWPVPQSKSILSESPG